jgi:hypothetical protein
MSIPEEDNLEVSSIPSYKRRQRRVLPIPEEDKVVLRGIVYSSTTKKRRQEVLRGDLKDFKSIEL